MESCVLAKLMTELCYSVKHAGCSLCYKKITVISFTWTCQQ